MPKKVDRADRRRVISDAVLELVNESGVGGVTIREVAARTEWSTGVISHYFKNREELLQAALHRTATLAAERQKNVISLFRGIQAAAAVLEDALPIDKSRRAFARIFIFYYSESFIDEKLRSEVVGYIRAWQRLVEKLLIDAQAAGDLCPHIRPAAMAQELVAAVDGLSAHMLLNDDLARTIRSSEITRDWIDKLGACPRATPCSSND